MSTHTFLWHDYETFGAVPRRDRPAQFAAIRTDAELNEIGEPIMLYCQPAPDFLPDPQACLITGITPQHCLEHGVPEHEFAATIERGVQRAGHDRRRLQHHPLRRRSHALPVLAQPDRPVCARVAERLRPLGPARRGAHDLRAAPGRHRVADARGRQAQLQAGRPDARQRPAARGRARRAVRRARHHRAGAPDPRAASRSCSTSASSCTARTRWPARWACTWTRAQRQPFLHVSGMFPAERGCLALVWPLATHPTNKNEVLVWDCRHDPSELFDLDVDTIRLRLFTRSRRAAGGRDAACRSRASTSTSRRCWSAT